MTSTRVDAGADAGQPAEAPSGGRATGHTPHRWWVLAVIGLAQLMVVLDATIVNIALPSAQRDLGFNNDGRQWVVTAYSLAFGSLLLLGGRLADLFGRKTTLIIGLVGFAGSSALAGAANGFSMLVIGRALQGLFGALLAPSALSLLTTTFTDAKERAKAFGIFGAIAGSGGAIGLLLGGVLTEHLDWRWTLYVNLAIAVVAVIGALIFVRRPAPTARPRLDLFGTLLVAAGLFGIVFGFSSAETHAWSHWMCWAFLAGGGVLLLAFVLWETRAGHPLLPLRVLGDRNRAASFISVFISGAGMFGVFLFLTYYLQQTLAYTPVKTGLAFLPMVGMLMVMAQLSMNILVPKIGPKPIVPLGMLFAGAGMIWLTRLDLDSTYAAHVLPPLLVMGFGLGMVMPPAMSLATLGVAPSDQGVASATVNTMQQVGGSIGTALFNTMAASAVTDYLSDRRPTKLNQAEAALHSYDVAYWWAAAFFAAGLVITLLLYRRGKAVADHGPAVPVEPEHHGRHGAAHDESVPEDGTGTAELPVTAAAATPAGPSVHGRVLDAAGAPVPAAAVTLIDSHGSQLGRATAAADGQYAMATPAAGSYVLVGAAAGHQPRVATLAVGEEPVAFDLMLAGTGGLEGTVRAGSSPVPSALVVATDERGDVIETASSGEDGGYRLPSLVPGVYTLTASATGFQPYAGIVEVSGGVPTRQDAVLQPAATLSGTVHNGAGTPLGEARVSLLDPAGNVVAVRTTGPDGAYAFTDLSGGEYTVVASGYPPAAAPLTVTEEGQDGFDIVLSHGD
ncbi:MFS transporter [Streptomyces ochraceiscleroticus]|uniref:DHA2 family efflux MFS transporter permease subunit n=1 Tax=Streptomyces ochraceiscleroticus TaxID=47761 RepID=A0ABW1MJ48_9ACTN|nr:MFS transporter [Streptomyces ochraceiscleroticus]